MQQWNTELYDGNHAFVFQFGKDLLSLLKPGSGELILDVGCGTAHLTSEIAKSGANVIGIDSSHEMVHQAQTLYPFIPFFEADAANFSLDTINQNVPFDAVFSNATLHWIANAKGVVQCLNSILKPQGRMVLEFGGKGNVELIRKAARKALFELTGRDIPDTFYFPSPAEYASLLEECGFRVQALWHFDRPTPLEGENGIANWLRMFGGAIFGDVDAEIREKACQRAQEILIQSSLYGGDASWTADYVRLRVVARKIS